MNTPLYNITRVLVLLVIAIAAPLTALAQETAAADTLTSTVASAPALADNTPATTLSDSLQQAINQLEAPADTAALSDILKKSDTHMLRARREHKLFTPDPQRALWLSFVIPGGGQIYNRKYWKLPVFYGGFLGCMYAFTWNQQMYMDYSQAYLDIMDDNPDTHSYLDMFPASYEIDKNVSRFKGVFKNRKDRYRRWRDLSAFCFIGVYALSIIDAYVDAHLSVFDITPDLSLQWGPTSVEGPVRNIGIGAALSF